MHLDQSLETALLGCLAKFPIPVLVDLSIEGAGFPLRVGRDRFWLQIFRGLTSLIWGLRSNKSIIRIVAYVVSPRPIEGTKSPGHPRGWSGR
jgi:hypothetical protein